MLAKLLEWFFLCSDFKFFLRLELILLVAAPFTSTPVKLFVVGTLINLVIYGIFAFLHFLGKHSTTKH